MVQGGHSLTSAWQIPLAQAAPKSQLDIPEDRGGAAALLQLQGHLAQSPNPPNCDQP